jgi:hypothetical protein
LTSLKKKFIISIAFSFALFVIVWLSAILENITNAVATGWSSGIPLLMGYSVGIFFLFVFLIVPVIIFSMWSVSPLVVKKMLGTFDLDEEML